MGKYDDILVGFKSDSSPTSSGKYGDIVAQFPQKATNAETIEPGIYGDTNPTGQKILENLGTVAGGYGVGALAGTGIVKAAESKLGRALLNSPKTIGAQMEPGLAKAGIEDRPPELATSAKFENPYQHPSQLSNPKGGRIPRLKPEIPAEPLPTTVPLKYPEDPATFYNFANSRLKGFASSPENVRLTPQEINDYKTILSEKLTDMTNRGMVKTPIYQKLSDLQSRVSDLHSSIIPGRAELNDVYALSKSIRDIPRKVVSAGKTISKGGLYAALAAKFLSQ